MTDFARIVNAILEYHHNEAKFSVMADTDVERQKHYERAFAVRQVINKIADLMPDAARKGFMGEISATYDALHKMIYLRVEDGRL